MSGPPPEGAGNAPDLAAECRRLTAALAEAHAERERAQAQLGRFVEDLLLVNRQRKAALIAARKSARSQSRFLGHVSHELRAPLTTIVGFAELLARDPDAADRADSADRIRRAALRLNATVDTLIDATRHGEQAPTRSPVIDLVACLHSVVEAARLAGSAAGRSIEVEVPGHAVPLACDEARLRQALGVLIDEAASGMRSLHLNLQPALGDAPPSLVLTALGPGGAEPARGIGQVLAEALLESSGAGLTRETPSGGDLRWVIRWFDPKSDI